MIKQVNMFYVEGRRQLETITGNSRNQNIAKLQERRAKSKSLSMYDRNHTGHSSELQQGSAYTY